MDPRLREDDKPSSFLRKQESTCNHDFMDPCFKRKDDTVWIPAFARMTTPVIPDLIRNPHK